MAQLSTTISRNKKNEFQIFSLNLRSTGSGVIFENNTTGAPHRHIDWYGEPWSFWRGNDCRDKSIKYYSKINP